MGTSVITMSDHRINGIEIDTCMQVLEAEGDEGARIPQGEI